MTNEIICPICSTKNDASNEYCQKCGFSLPKEEKSDNDWLSNLRSDEQSSFSEDPFESTEKSSSDFEGDDQPDWLNRIRDKQSIEENYNYLQSNLPTKGNQISETEPQKPFESNDAQENNDQIPDWLNQMRDDPGTSKSEENEDLLPDWMKDPSAKQELSPVTSEKDDAENLPDWLSDLSQPETEDLTIDTEEHEGTSIEDQPDWLSKLQAEPDDKSDELITPFSDNLEAESEEEERPSWMPQQDDRVAEETTEQQKESDEPDWLQEINFIKDETDKAPLDINTLFTEDSEEQTTEFEPLEEAFTSFSEEVAPHEEAVSPLSDPFLQEAMDTNQIDPSPFNLEEGIQQNSSAFSFSEPGPFTDPAIDEPAEKDEPASFTSQPFKFDEMPDWLEDIDKVQGTDEDEVSQDSTSSTDLKAQPGNLPQWLKAMRPIGAVVPSEIRSEDRKRVEKSGPLAGLQGILSSESAVTHYSTPPTYASKVQITDKNRVHINFLDEVFSQKKTSSIKTQAFATLDILVIRIGIPVLLVLVMLLSLFNPNFNLEARANNMPATQFASIANTLSTTLDHDPRILTVMETNAASIGEIQIVAQKPMEAFMLQNAWITTIATNPTGLLLTDQLVGESQQYVSSFNRDEHIINLGYLPGHETGIQTFLSNPKFIIQRNENNTSIWENPGLLDIDEINDFDLVWIVTDDAELTKKWIEQLQATQFSKPVLVSATSQAAPMLLPYLNSEQFDGLIGGLPGATTYEQLSTNIVAPHAQTWQLYQSSIFFFIAIILFGLIFQIIKSVTKKSKA